MPEFFIPDAKNRDQEKLVLNSVIDFVSEEFDAKVDSQRIYKLKYVHDGRELIAEVGKQHKYNNEPIIVILHDELKNLYLVCTPHRGVIGGIPIMVGETEVKNKILFDNL